MLYPILVEYYVWFSLALLCITWFTRQHKPKTRTNLIYGYAMVSAIGFLLGLKWMAGVVFGLIILEVGRAFKSWLDKKEENLKK